MEEILQNPTSETLADAVKHNLYAFFHRIQRNYPLRTGTESGLVTWQTALPHPWFNAVLSTQPPGEEAPVTIQEVLEEFASRGVESISWWLAPELQPETWEVFLLNAGFARDSNTPGMAVKLENLER